MARFQCGPCDYDDHATWTGELVCPRCGGTEGVRAAIAADEMTEGDLALLEAAVQRDSMAAQGEGA